LPGIAPEKLKDDLIRRALFLRSMLTHPRRVGAVWPTSKWAVRDLLDMADLGSARTVVEFGVGTGVYTREVLARLAPGARFLAFEVDRELAAAAGRRLADPRLRVVCDSAENVASYLNGEKADVIVCSIPFTSLPAEVREGVLRTSGEVLSPGGSMLVLQYSNAVRPALRRHFGQVHQRVSPLNFPPAFLFACREPVSEPGS
jgi:phospholipid N-methyltransferase